MDKFDKNGNIINQRDNSDWNKKKYIKNKGFNKVRKYTNKFPTARDYNNPAYKEARLKCYKRDGFKCKKCGSKDKIQAHHILSWSTYPHLRFNWENLITLCEKCHKEIKGKEDYYINYFHTLLINDSKEKFVK